MNVRTARGETALHLAVISRKAVDNALELVTALLDVGCDANIQDNLQGRTALLSLVRQLADSTSNLCPLVLETLKKLARKSDVNLQDHRQRTPLHRLAASGCTHLDAFQVSSFSNFILEIKVSCSQYVELKKMVRPSAKKFKTGFV